ncbi:MAG: RNA methyltransferase [Deferrisomatales bacterium]|nr:RNA methyltransferase [Deferrisomatales bacterium]
MGCLDRLSVVLVEPLYGGNVGSVARVMANFGLSRLVLVNPAPGVREDPALGPMARTAEGLVRGADLAGTLDEALAGADLALGFTTRLGKRRRDGLDLRQALERLAREAGGARVSAVFGREDKGLTNAELERCQWLVRIPTAPGLPSLNLAQAVGLFCYEASLALGARGSPAGPRPAAVPELEGLYRHAERVLQEIGFIEEASPRRMMNEVRRIFSRRLPEPRDVRILRGILAKMEGALKRSGHKG